MNELALFAGAGGGILGGRLLGWRTVCAVEIDDYCRRVLMQRQDDGHLDPFPIWDDVRTFDGRPWQGRVDVVSGGFPCQDISHAGKRQGITGSRSGLWGEMARIVGEVRPRFVLVENVAALTSRGLGRVLGDLAELGYDAKWGVLGTRDAGGPCWGDRLWIVATANRVHVDSRLGPDSCQTRKSVLGPRPRQREDRNATPWPPPPDQPPRVDHGLAHRVDRIRATGNGQCPALVRLAWETLALEGRERTRKGRL